MSHDKDEAGNCYEFLGKRVWVNKQDLEENLGILDPNVKKSTELDSGQDSEESLGILDLNVKKSTEMGSRQDSEESLGILDPNMYNSSNSWDLLNLNTDGDIVSISEDSILKCDKQESYFADPFLPSSVFSKNIGYPCYASTPRHCPVKKRCTDLPVQNVDKDDVFDNGIDLEREFFFDTEKLRSNPSLTSTGKFFQVINTSPDMNKYLLVQSNPDSRSTDLNMTKVISLPSITDQEIPISMDLNKTQLFQNQCLTADALSTTFKVPSGTDSPDNKNLNLTVCLKIEEISGNYQKASQVETAADRILEANCLETKDLNSTVCLETKDLNLTVCLETKDLNSTVCLQERKESNILHQASQVGVATDTMSENKLANSEDLNLTMSLKIQEGSENCLNLCEVQSDKCTTGSTETSSQISEKTEKHDVCLVSTLADMRLCENINLNDTYDLDLKFDDVSVKLPVDVNITFNSNLINGRDKSIMEKTFILDSSPSVKKQNCKLKTSVDFLRNSSAQLNSFHEKSQETCAASMSSENLKNASSKQLKTNNANGNVVDFKRPLPMRYSIPKPKTRLKNAPTISIKNSDLKESVPEPSMKHSISKIILKNRTSSIDMNLSKQEKENENLNSVENKFTLQEKSLVYNVNSENKVNNKDAKCKKKLSVPFDVDTRCNKQATVKSRYSRPFSYLQTTENVGLNITNKSLLGSGDALNLKGSQEIKFLPSPAKDMSRGNVKNKAIVTKTVNGTCDNITNKSLLGSGDALSLKGSHEIKFLPSPAKDMSRGNIKNKAIVTKTVNGTCDIVKSSVKSQLKKPDIVNQLPISQPSPRLSSNGYGNSRRNSLAASSKTSLPVGIIKPRYSMLPLIKERNLAGTKNGVSDVEKNSKSCDGLVAKDVPIASCQDAEAQSSKTTRIASLPQKSQIATRSMAQKHDVKEENSAPSKITRYNLRKKK